MGYLLPLMPALLTQLLLVGFTPGPANIFALSVSIRYGRKAAMRVWYGMLTGFTIAAVIAAAMAHALGSMLGSYVAYIKYLGAAYILYLAYRTLRSTGIRDEEDQACTFISGMLVQLTNAKMIVFGMMAFNMFVLPYSNRFSDLLVNMFVLPYSNRFSDLLVLVLFLEIAGPGANLAWLLAGGFLSRFFKDYRRQNSIVMAVLLALCAIWIALQAGEFSALKSLVLSVSTLV